MSYATAEDMVARFSLVELVNLAPSNMPEEYDLVKVNTALADSQSEINSYLVGRYTVPLGTVPEIIKSACCDLARYRLYAAQSTEEVQQRYRDRIKWLVDVAAGKAGLGVAQLNTTQTLAVSTTSPGRTFTRDSLAGY